ncbi:MAG: hypothetical protein FD149_1753 [Rhodospirillaceae bacterium]|nr:MAG: hypothetical protein FD149_1753 [Rhodospirillaceae bacterium]
MMSTFARNIPYGARLGVIGGGDDKSEDVLDRGQHESGLFCFLSVGGDDETCPVDDSVEQRSCRIKMAGLKQNKDGPDLMVQVFAQGHVIL